MGSVVVRRFRTLEIIICSGITLIGFLVLFAPKNGGTGALVAWGVAGGVALLFELRIHGARRHIERIRLALEEIARRDFDAPTPCMERTGDAFVEEIASSRTIASMLAGRASRLFVAGTWRGRNVEMGTTMVAGRDFDQYISYACVTDGWSPPMFRVMTRGAVTRLARVAMTTHPVKTGDAAFDDAWIVDADDRVCRAVLDDELRRTLVALRTRLAWMQVASIEATRFGLVVRWPGELSPDSAAYLRDLAFSVHDRVARAT